MGFEIGQRVRSRVRGPDVGREGTIVSHCEGLGYGIAWDGETRAVMRGVMFEGYELEPVTTIHGWMPDAEPAGGFVAGEDDRVIDVLYPPHRAAYEERAARVIGEKQRGRR